MLLKMFQIGVVLAALFTLVFYVIVPFFNTFKKVKVEESKDPMDDIDSLVKDSERVAVATKTVKKRASRAKSKLNTVENNLKNN